MQPVHVPGLGLLPVGTVHMLRERLSSLHFPLMGTRAPASLPAHLEQYLFPFIATSQTPPSPPHSLSVVHSKKTPPKRKSKTKIITKSYVNEFFISPRSTNNSSIVFLLWDPQKLAST